ncbi:MAG: hypothetical protein WCC17_25205 [Candidatus Nitrosopolaris sp.]
MPGTLNGIAQKYNVNIANVATRYILDNPAVAGVIIGVRLGIAPRTTCYHCDNYNSERFFPCNYSDEKDQLLFSCPSPLSFSSADESA